MKNADQLKEDIVFEAVLGEHTLRLHSTWGLFSPRCVDPGSRLLVRHVKVNDGDVTLDLGCGYGAIGLAVAKLTPAGTVHMVDKDFIAVQFAKKNAKVNRLDNCQVYLSNAFSTVPPVAEVQFENILANLPANVGREMLYIILADAHRHLKPGGQLVVVTIAGLKAFIKRNFNEVFGNYKKLKQGKTHIVAAAVKQ